MSQTPNKDDSPLQENGVDITTYPTEGEDFDQAQLKKLIDNIDAIANRLGFGDVVDGPFWGAFANLAIRLNNLPGVLVKVTGADTTPGNLDDKIVFDDSLEREILSPGANEQFKIKRKLRTAFFPIMNTNATFSSYRTRNVGSNGGTETTFQIPADFTDAASSTLKLVGIISAGAAQTLRNIDFFADIASIGDDFDDTTVSDVATTYDLSTSEDKLFGFDLTTLILGSVVAGSFVGLSIDHNSLGGTIDYLGLVLDYK